MASTSPKLAASWLHQRSNPMNALLSRIHLLGRITAAVRTGLPKPLAPHCHAANIDGDILVLGCDSSAWAAKLRFQLSSILDRLKDHRELPDFRQIRIRVQPADEERFRISSPRPAMTGHVSALIAAAADHTVDPELKAALHRLSQRAQSVKNR